jgi:VWFA-related protein
MSFVSMQVDEEPIVRHAVLEWPTGAGGRGWTFETDLVLTEELQDAAVVIEDLASGRWGGTWVEFTNEASRRPPGFVVLREWDPPSEADRGLATAPAGESEPVPEAKAVVDESTVIRLVPPSSRPIVGRARFRTVVTTEAVEKAIFYVDGQEVSVDERAPFSAVIDLGKEPARHKIRVAAFGFRDLPLGEDVLEINLDAQPFRVAIRELTELGSGAVRVAVDLSVPPGESLARLEFYRNTDLAATVTGPPFEAEMAGADGPGDFVRVLAVLATGESLEDAQILAPGIISERVEVNLVEVYAVVTDQEGKLATDLTVEQFRLKRGRREVPIERFALADEVPLVLGLIVDSSESMYPLMVETRRAAGQFFSSTLKESDRGFLVDFDTKPRMAQGLTGELDVLLRGLRELRPGGATAIYDATVFSLSQFESEPGRRALVLLTDGRDYGSRFSTRRCVQEARRLGVPLYVIVLNNLGLMPNAWKMDTPQKPPPVDTNLETLSLQTGGRLFNLAGTAELADVYATINAELRSQYLLAFSTDERLEEKELKSLEVEVEGRGLEVRTVTLNR